jgi:hypothetical protein
MRSEYLTQTTSLSTSHEEFGLNAMPPVSRVGIRY